MEQLIDKITDLVNKKNIRIITICEPNHRSYTSHTFNFNLMKSLLKNTKINTFSTEKLGVFDAMMINYYLTRKKDIPVESFEFKGLGTKRWLSYFKKIKSDRYNFVGGEFNPYNPYGYEKEALKEFFSEQFINSILDPAEGGGEIQAVTDNDKLAKESFLAIENFYKNREKFWLKNIERILDTYDNLFIVGFHLAKNDPIGKMITSKYPDNSLFLGTCSLEITTQILILDNKFNQPDSFNMALEAGKYIEKVDRIDKWAPPTPFEIKRKDWSMTKVTQKNKNKKIRGIGCYIGMTQKEYYDEKKISGIHSRLSDYDYIIFFKTSVYCEDMFE